MEKIIEAIPKYFPILQKPFCCSCACVQMVLLRHGIIPPLQDDIAKFTGVPSVKEDLRCFMRKLKVMKSPHFDTATQSTERIYNKFFKSRNLPFKVKAFKVSSIKDPKKFIMENLIAGNDIHAEYLQEVAGKSSIHDSIVSKIRYGRKTIVTLIDPWWANKQYHDVRLEDFISSMKKVKERELGFLIYYEK
jgi:hypothetical protein